MSLATVLFLAGEPFYIRVRAKIKDVKLETQIELGGSTFPT